MDIKVAFIHTSYTHIIGAADNPAVSCAAILSAAPSARSGMYFLRSANADPSDSPTSVFCDMTLNCDGVVGGWRQIADISPDAGCGDFPNSGGFCRISLATGCGVGQTVPVHGIEYSQVCGRIIGTRVGSFAAFGVNPGATTIEDIYVEGISVATFSFDLGVPVTHIWTFAVSNDGENSGGSCPCVSNGSPQPPSFVGTNYFCEGGDDPLWDGEGCSAADSCSCTANGPPLFLRTLDSPIAEPIQAIFCTNDDNEVIGFVLQLYVR